MNDTTAALIVLAVLAVLGAGGYWVYGQMRGVAKVGDDISDQLVTRYVSLVQAGRYDEAWEGCLDDTARAAVPQAQFARVHADRVQRWGALTGFRRTTVEHIADLGGEETLVGVRAVLTYERRDVFVSYRVASARQPYRIRASFGSEGRSDSLSEGIW